jgi:hypothetical protein
MYLPASLVDPHTYLSKMNKIMQVYHLSMILLAVTTTLVSCNSSPSGSTTNPSSTTGTGSTKGQVNLDPPTGTLELPIPLNLSIDTNGKISLKIRPDLKIPTPIGTVKLSLGGVSMSTKDIEKIEQSHKDKRILIVRVDKEAKIYEIEKGKKFDIKIASNDRLYKTIEIKNEPNNQDETLVVEIESVASASTQPNETKSSMQSFCPKDMKAFVSAETDNFLLYICGIKNPTNYVGIAKNGGASTILPLMGGHKDQFVAKNGSYTYTLNSTLLTVANGNEILKEDPVKSYKLSD